jgi:predicted lipoprotein with Yx(FWY)xxD motif
MLRRTSVRMLGLGPVLAGVAVLVAACGGASGTSAASSPAAATPTTTSSSAAPSAAAGGATVALKTDKGSAGIWLTDAAGRTLYLYTQDQGTMSTCYGSCATDWPPLTTTGSVSVTGEHTSQKEVGVTKRTDGTTQVTYGGHPLYYYKGDTAPGQITGQGVGGVWFLEGPVGNVMNGTKPPQAPTTTP